MGEAGIAVCTAVRPLTAVQVHVVDKGRLLRECLVAQRALVALGPCSTAVYCHVPFQVVGVLEMLVAAEARVQQVGGVCVDSQGLGRGEC